MGVPVIVAPCEAEAQASALCKEGLFYATATEDMDALTFQTPILVRKMTFANQSKSMVQTINYQKAIEGLGLTYDQFVDLCILLGCDYTDTIKGVGPKTALKLIKEHGSIEGILKVIDRKKYEVPRDWIPDEKDEEDTDNENDENNENSKEEKVEPAYVQARKLFHNHEVRKGSELSDELKWREPQVEELTKFLVEENGFNPERVHANIEKLQKAYKANQKPQSRMDSFFQVKANPLAAQKRKKVEETKNTKSKVAKTAGGRKKR
jgi:flap endonuclease-1